MFVEISKVLWFIAQPLSLVLLLGLAGLLLGFTRWRKLSQLSVLLSLVVLGLCAFSSFGYVLIQPLEARFSRPDVAPADISGIIVLGGGMDADINGGRRGYELNRSGDRFTEALRLALLYPQARVVISGGTGVFFAGEDSEAAAGARFFEDFGIPPERLVLETRARNTEENAQFTRQLLEPMPGEVWLLVTSAFHMPRSAALFRKAGFPVIPWPADYLGTGVERFGIKLDQPAENVGVAGIAIREWIGLLAYYVTGKIDALLPGPE
ncbi:MAG: YdcF family protein [Devosia sp.]|nr:YdcF family protein [Devosia sp.]